MMGAVGTIDFRRPRSALATVDSSRRAAGRERAAADFYCEPRWAVEGLLDVQRFAGSVWDPACGRGTIPEAFKSRGHLTIASDLHERGYGPGGRDFLAWQPFGNEAPPVVDNIVSNPPFAIAEPFLRQALRLARHKVALLLRLSWAEGQGRRWIWDESPIAAIHPFAARVSMPPGDSHVAAKGGAVAFAWFIWSKDWQGPPIIRRIERRPA